MLSRRELLMATGALVALPRGAAATSRIDVTDPADLGVLAAAAMLRRRSLSAVELTHACLRRVDERNGGSPSFDGAPRSVNAWARLYPELALRHARAADRRLAKGRAPLLCGIPLGLKDLFAVRGLPLTASSRVLAGNVARRDSAVWRRLHRDGMVLLGHTHTHEFGVGPTTDQVGNPWRLARSAGGSSGGSAAALAAGMVPAATGTDTGGSLRYPAAVCAVSAIKPTRGLVPTTDVIPVAASLDHAGPMARTVADCAALLAAMAGRRLPTRPLRGSLPLAGLTVAVTDRLPDDGLSADVAHGLDRAGTALERLGARLTLLAAPRAAGLAESGYASIFSTELWSYHQRHADRRRRYRPAVAALVRSAAAQAGIGLAAARVDRDRVIAAWIRWFEDHRIDLILEPTAPTVAPDRGSGYRSGSPELGALLPYMALWNATGFPVVSLPAGIGRRSGLPVGVSLIAPAGADARAIQAAIDLQERTLRPPLLGPRSGG